MSAISAPDLDLIATDVENDLRSTVRDLLADRCPPHAVTSMYDGDRTVVEPLWRALAVDIGLAGLLVPEDLGGAGASAVEAAAVLEELGRASAPVPFLTSSVVATTALLACAEDDAACKVISALAAGERTAALVVPFSTAPDGSLPDITATDGRLTGAVRSVAGALEADLLVVPAQTTDGVALYLVERSAATVEPVVSLDMARQVADVTLDGATGQLVLADSEAAVRSALLVGAGLLASEQVGIARWCLAGDRRLPQGAQAVRPRGGRLPSAQAPPGRSVRRGRVRLSDRPVRRRGDRRGRGRADRRPRRRGVLQRHRGPRR